MRSPRYLVATSGSAESLSRFAGIVYLRGPDASADEAVDQQSGFPTRSAARRWAVERIRQMGNPA